MINTANKLVGLIPRNMLIVLGRERAFYEKTARGQADSFTDRVSKSVKQ